MKRADAGLHSQTVSVDLGSHPIGAECDPLKGNICARAKCTHSPADPTVVSITLKNVSEITHYTSLGKQEIAYAEYFGIENGSSATQYDTLKSHLHADRYELVRG